MDETHKARRQGGPLNSSESVVVASDAESQDFATQKNLAEDFVNDFDATSDLMEQRSRQLQQLQSASALTSADLGLPADFKSYSPLDNTKVNSTATTSSTGFLTASESSIKEDRPGRQDLTLGNAPYVGVWTGNNSIWGAPKSDGSARPLTPDPSSHQTLMSGKFTAGVQVDRNRSDNLNKTSLGAFQMAPTPSSFQKSKLALQDLIDQNTVSIQTFDKIKPKQIENLFKFNGRCLFCHKRALLHKQADSSFYFISDKKNSKYFLAHKQCGLSVAQKYAHLDSYLLQSNKIDLFKQVVSESTFPLQARGGALKCSLLIQNPLYSEKPYYRIKNYPIVALTNQSYDCLFLSKKIASFHLGVSFVKLRLEVETLPPLEAGIDLFALKHEVDIGSKVQCDVDLEGVTVILEFIFHELRQPDGVESNEESADSEEEEESEEGGNFEYLLQNVKVMIKFAKSPFPESAVKKSRPNSPSKFQKKNLKLAEPDSSSSEDEKIVIKKPQGVKDKGGCTKSKGIGAFQIGGLSALKKFSTESQIVENAKKYIQPTQVPRLNENEMSDGTNSELSQKVEPTLPGLAPLKGGLALPKFTSWAGVQNLSQNSASPQPGPPPTLFQKQLESQHPHVQQQPYFLAPQSYGYQVPSFQQTHFGGMYQSGVIQPPPGLAKIQGSSYVENSQGIGFAPYTAPSFNPLLGIEPFAQDDMVRRTPPTKKALSALKKKINQKQKLVSYYGEVLTLTMGIDAKDTQVTEFEVQLFSRPDEVENVEGKIVELAKSYSGSRALQGYLSKGSPEVVAKIIAESTEGICRLMTDKYGNYYCQKLLQSCSVSQRLQLLKNVSYIKSQMIGSFFKISADWSGTHSMQRLIELLGMEEEFALVQTGINGQVLEYAIQPQATHVLQKVIMQFPEHKIEYIFEPVVQNLLELCNDQNGLCVVKKLISQTHTESKVKRISQGLAQITRECVQDPYGNYAIQHAVETWSEPAYAHYRAQILAILLRSAIQFSSTKYSSNVIEKCVELLPQEFGIPFARQALLAQETLVQLLNNLFGTFVVQKLIECLPASSEPRTMLLSGVQTYMKSMTDKSLKGKWESFMKREIGHSFPQTLKIQKRGFKEDTSPNRSGLSPTLPPSVIKLNPAAQSFSAPRKN